MIKVHLIKKDDQYISLEVVGHANYAEHGQDLVCAAVSAIVTGGFNAFNDSDIKSIELKEGYAFVTIEEMAQIKGIDLDYNTSYFNF